MPKNMDKDRNIQVIEVNGSSREFMVLPLFPNVPCRSVIVFFSSPVTENPVNETTTYLKISLSSSKTWRKKCLMINILQCLGINDCLEILFSSCTSTLPASKLPHHLHWKQARWDCDTCVAHIVAERSPQKVGKAAGVIGRLWVPAQLTLGSGRSVGTEVSCVHGGHCFPAGVIAGFSFTDPFEDMVESQDMPHLMDHDVGMARHPIIGRVEDNATCSRRFEKHLWACKEWQPSDL